MRRTPTLRLGGALALALAVGCSDSGGGGPLPASTTAGSSSAAATSSGATPTNPPPGGAGNPLAPAPIGSYPAPAPGTLGVIAISPPDYGRDMPTSTPVVLTFSEPVAGADLANAATLDRGDGPVAGSWSAQSGDLVHTFTPHGGLEAATTYVLRLKGSLRARSGTPLAGPYRMAFSTTEVPRAPLLAGAAAVDVTPPVGVPLGGYGAEERRLPGKPLIGFQSAADHDPSNYHVLFKPSMAKRDPIRAKALVLDDGVRKVAIVSLDAIGCSSRLFDDLAPRVLRETGIRPADLFVHGTHTHHGPGAISHDLAYWFIAMDYFDPRVYDPMLDGAVQAVRDAAAALRPAALGATTVQEDRIGQNRRTHPGRYGKDLHVIKVEEPGGAPIATLFNLPFHPSALAVDDLRLSADVAGEAERHIEGAVGGVGLFVNGCEGDVKARTGSSGRSEAAMVALGQTLGARVVSELPGIATTRDLPLSAVQLVQDMGPPQYRVGCSPSAAQLPTSICSLLSIFGAQPTLHLPLANLHSQVFRFGALRLGDQALIGTIPGEPITNVGNRITSGLAQVGVGRPVLFGLTNGHMAYITDAAEFDEGGYEAESTLFGRDTGDRVIQHTLFVTTHLVR